MVPNITIVIILLCSHSMALYPALAGLRKGFYPTVVDCSIASLILYYDIGILAEMSGLQPDNRYFAPFFQTGGSNIVWCFVLLCLAPWLLRLGGVVIVVERRKANRRSRLVGSRVILFFLLSVIATIACLYIAYLHVSMDAIWVTRSELSTKLGPTIILLYLPMYILMFFIQQKESSSFIGTLFSAILVVASIACTVFIGQRTLVLMPILAFGLFRSRASLRRFALMSAFALVAAAALLPIFKWQFAEQESFMELAKSTVVSDFHRGPILAETVEKSPAFGSSVLPYPGEGYVYSALFFVPRSLVWFKGNSTAQVFTAAEDNNTVEGTDWGFGISAIDELLLNFGKVLSIPGLALYGILLSLLDRLGTKIPTCAVPVRFCGIWLMGYQLPALLMLFGGMILVAVALSFLFARTEQIH